MRPNDVQSDTMMVLETNPFSGMGSMGEDLPSVPLGGGFDIKPMLDEGKQLLSEVTNSGIPAFPWRLHDMLDDAPRKNYEHIVSWELNGKAFKVHDQTLFVKEIMPMFFNQTQYKSFQRQLNIYGFQRMTHGSNKGAYTHDLFVRGKPDMCRFMIRTKIKNKGVKAPPAQQQQLLRHGGLSPNRSCPDTLRALQQAMMKQQEQSNQTSVDSRGGFRPQELLHSNSLNSFFHMTRQYDHRQQQHQEPPEHHNYCSSGAPNQQWGMKPHSEDPLLGIPTSSSYRDSIMRHEEGIQPFGFDEMAGIIAPDIAKEIASIFR